VRPKTSREGPEGE